MNMSGTQTPSLARKSNVSRHMARRSTATPAPPRIGSSYMNSTSGSSVTSGRNVWIQKSSASVNPQAQHPPPSHVTVPFQSTAPASDPALMPTARTQYLRRVLR